MQSQMPFLKVLHTLEPIQKDSAICETIAVRLIRTWVKHLFHFTWATSCATNFTIFPWSWTALYTVILTSLDRECGRNVGGRVLQQCFWHRLCCSVKLARFVFFSRMSGRWGRILPHSDNAATPCPLARTLAHSTAARSPRLLKWFASLEDTELRAAGFLGTAGRHRCQHVTQRAAAFHKMASGTGPGKASWGLRPPPRGPVPPRSTPPGRDFSLLWGHVCRHGPHRGPDSVCPSNAMKASLTEHGRRGEDNGTPSLSRKPGHPTAAELLI